MKITRIPKCLASDVEHGPQAQQDGHLQCEISHKSIARGAAEGVDLRFSPCWRVTVGEIPSLPIQSISTLPLLDHVVMAAT